MNESNESLVELLTLTISVTDALTTYTNTSGQLHRIHGPAVIWCDGEVIWYQDGKHHREGGPAQICASGTKFWYHHGALHRVDGPAVEYSDGEEGWFLYNEEFTKEEFCERIRSI